MPSAFPRSWRVKRAALLTLAKAQDDRLWTIRLAFDNDCRCSTLVRCPMVCVHNSGPEKVYDAHSDSHSGRLRSLAGSVSRRVTWSMR